MAFARALDLERWDDALAQLTPDCLYETPRGPLRGAAAIIASYRSSAEKATALFAEVRYRSRLLASAVGVRLEFTDDLLHGSDWHAYTSWQRQWFQGPHICRIVAEESLVERTQSL